MSFFADKVVSEGLTFDDVLLIPSYSEVLPREVDLSSWFTRNIRLHTPIVTAAMDTVTDSLMAIAIARGGGIGVIHKNMSIAEQAKQVASVKRAENGMIYDPVTISKEKTVRDAIGLMKTFKIGGIPVVDDQGCLVGHCNQPRPAFRTRHEQAGFSSDDQRQARNYQYFYFARIGFIHPSEIQNRKTASGRCQQQTDCVNHL